MCLTGLFFNYDCSHSKLPAAARAPRYLALTPLEGELNFHFPSVSVLSRGSLAMGRTPDKVGV
jgi:hypothetical protein